MQIISLKILVEIQQIVFHVATSTLIARDKLRTVLRYHENWRESYQMVLRLALASFVTEHQLFWEH